MEIRQTSTQKLGSKKSPYKDTVIWKDLISMIKQNSHDYPEIMLDPSGIFFSGTEESPEKMNVISTQFELCFDINMLFKDTFEKCWADDTCKDVVPSLISIVNDMQDTAVDTTGMTRLEK